MQGKLHFYLITFLVGLGSAVFCSIQIPSYLIVIGVVAAVVLHVVHRVRFVAGFCAAFLVGYYGVARTVESQLPHDLEQKNIELLIVVDGLPQVSPPFTRFNARVVDWAVPGAPTQIAPGSLHEATSSENLVQLAGKKLRLSWRHNVQNGDGDFSESVHIRPGDTWRLTARLKRPRGMVNPGGFDYQAWLLQQDVFATGYVVNKLPSAKIAQREGWSVDGQRFTLLQSLRSALTVGDEISPHLGLLQALLVGEKSDISPRQWQVLNQTGTTHLMAISGLHIGLVAVFAFFCSRLFLPLIMWQVRPVFLRLLPSLLCFIAAFFYALLADFSIPTQRALLFVLVINLTYVLGWRSGILFILLVVAIVVVFLNPFAFLQAGFWLSFIAVSCLLWSFSARVNAGKKWLSMMKAQWIVFAGLLLPLLVLGLPVAVISPVANLIAVPLVSFFCIPPLLLGALLVDVNPYLSDLFFLGANMVMTITWEMLEWLSNFAVTTRSGAGLGLAVIIVPAVILLLLSPWRLRFSGPLCLMLLSLTISKSQPADRITVLDVGQGLAVTILTSVEEASYALQYDAGARMTESFDLGDRVVVPYLKYAGVSELDTLIVSHGDNDHAGGVGSVIEHYPPRLVRTGAKEGDLLLIDQILEPVSSLHEYCGLGQKWSAGLYSFEVLWPPRGYAKSDNVAVDSAADIIDDPLMPSSGDSSSRDFSSGGFSLGDSAKNLDSAKNAPLDSYSSADLHAVYDLHERNNQSCVVLIRYLNLTVLLTGDIERSVEEGLLVAGVLPRDIDVLVAPHHGSKSSSSQEFVDWLSPRHVIFSAGFRNRYRHPAEVVVNRYREAGSLIWSTAQHGAISIHLQGGEVLIEGARRASPRLWYD